MCETLYINILIGAFTILGVIIGSSLDFLKERWKTKQEIKRSFLSPLSFRIHNLYIDIKTFKTYSPKEAVYLVKKIVTEISMIQEILEPNVHVLPQHLYFDLNYCLKVVGYISELFINTVEPLKKISKDEKEVFKITVQKFNVLENMISNFVAYTYLKAKGMKTKEYNKSLLTEEIIQKLVGKPQF